MGLLNQFLSNKKFWMNTDNWLIKSEDIKYIALKKSLLETIIRVKNVNDLSLTIIEDIDCLACLLKTHSISSSILIHKINHCSLIKNVDYVLHLLNIGIQDDSVCRSLLFKFKIFKNNQELAYKILTTKNDYVYFYFYRKLLKDENFALSLFDHKNFNNPFVLISLPYHKKISELLLFRESYPNQKTEDSKIKFNQDLLANIKIVNKILRKYTGHNLYNYLPTNMKENKEVCLTMLKYHPEYNTLNDSIKTLKNFKKASRFWFYYNDFIFQIKYFGKIFENEDNLFEALQCLKDFKRMSRFSPPSYSFQQHCMVDFIKSSNSPLIKDFLNTEKGKALLEIASQTTSNLQIIDDWIHEEFLIVLNKIKLYNKMSQLNNLKKEKKLKL
jgi:hypothetical protein